MKRVLWLSLLSLAIGIGLGVLYSWVLAPVQYVDTTPDSLSVDFKDQMRSVIAASYAATGNLERARARLALLGDEDPIQALSAQAQRMLASGDTYGSVEQVAMLAGDLQSGPSTVGIKSTPPTAAATLSTPQSTALVVGLTQTIIPEQEIQPPATVRSPTPRPTVTATPPPDRAYELVAQDTLCELDLQEGLMQVIVIDLRRREVAGAQIIVAWDGGEEHFFTGLKPELGNGYADFVMKPDRQYSIRVAGGGATISGVMAPACTAQDSSVSIGQVRLTFQQD